MNKLKSGGFAVIEIALVVVVLAIIGFAGYKVYQTNRSTSTGTKETTQNTNSATKATDVSPAPQVKLASDLDSAMRVLDETDPIASNTADFAAIDSAVAEF
jgi:Tfp pilus assembly protein PilV